MKTIILAFLFFTNNAMAADLHCFSKKRELVITEVNVENQTAKISYSYPSKREDIWTDYINANLYGQGAHHGEFVYWLSTGISITIFEPRDELNEITGYISFEQHSEDLSCDYY